jgi:hypothetical protein
MTGEVTLRGLVLPVSDECKYDSVICNITVTQ